MPVTHRTDPVVANGISNLATSLEAVALRLRRSIGDHAFRVLEWAATELERLQDDATQMAPEARVDEVEEAKR